MELGAVVDEQLQVHCLVVIPAHEQPVLERRLTLFGVGDDMSGFQNLGLINVALAVGTAVLPLGQQELSKSALMLTVTDENFSVIALDFPVVCVNF